MAKWYEKVANNTLGFVTGGLAGNENMGIADNIYRGGKDVLRDVPIVNSVLGLESSDDRAAKALQAGISGARGEINELFPQAHSLYDPYMGLAGQLNDPRFQNSPEMPGYLREQYQMDPYQMSEFNFQEDPGYQWEMEQALKGVNQGLAGRGLSESGGQLKALQDRAQGIARQGYGDAFGRYLQQNQMGQGIHQQNFAQGLAGRQHGLNVYGQNANMFNQMANRNQQVGLAGLGVIGDRANLYTSQADILGNLHTASGQAEAARHMAKAQGTRDMIQGGAQLGTMALLASDKRVKENTKLVGVKDGNLIHEFNYKGDPKKYRGVIAQEVQKDRPDAVHDVNGVLMVDYDKLGLKMEVV